MSVILSRFYLVCFALFLSISVYSQIDGVVPVAENELLDKEYYFFGIGINSYANSEINDLNNAATDITAVQELLSQQYGVKSILPSLIDEQATKDNIRKALEVSLPTQIKDDSGSLIVYFAGHGFNIEEKFGEVTTRNAYLLTYDSPGIREELTAQYYDILDFIDDVSKLKIKHITIIIDACSSGLALDLTSYRSLPVPGRLLLDLESKNSRCLITSAKFAQDAADSGTRKNNSLFTSLLLDGLSGSQPPADLNSDGYITMSEIFNTVKQQMARHTDDQTPDFGHVSKYDQKGEMILLNRNFQSSKAETSENQERYTPQEDISLDKISVVHFGSVENSLNALGTFIADDVSNALASKNFKDLKVLSPTALERQQFGTNTRTYQDLEKKLGINKIIEGQLVEDDGNIIVKSKLVDLRNKGTVQYIFPDIIISSQNYDIVANKVTDQVLGYFADEDNEERKFISPSYEAYQMYQKGMQAYRLKEYRTAISYFEKSIEIEPLFFRPHMYIIYAIIDDNANQEEWKKFFESIRQKPFNLSQYEKSLFHILELEVYAKYDLLVQEFYKLHLEYGDFFTESNTIGYSVRSNSCSMLRKLRSPKDFLRLTNDGRRGWYYLTFFQYFQTGIKDKYFDDVLRVAYNSNHYQALLGDIALNKKQVLVKDIVSNFRKTKASVRNRSFRGYCLEYASVIRVYNPESKLPDSLYQLIHEEYFAMPDEDKSNNFRKSLRYNFLAKKYAAVISTFEKQIDQLDSITSPAKMEAIPLYIMACTHLGKLIENEDSLLKEMKKSEPNSPNAYHQGLAYITLVKKDKSAAFSHVAKAYENGSGFSLRRYQFDPLLKDLRGYLAFDNFVYPK